MARFQNTTALQAIVEVECCQKWNMSSFNEREVQREPLPRHLQKNAAVLLIILNLYKN